MKYNWQHPDWPNFTYDGAQCKTTVYQYAMDAGRLSASVGQLSEPLQYDIYIDLMVNEAMNTTSIEGEHLAAQDIEAAIRNHLGLNKPQVPVENPRADSIGRLMVDVRRSFTEPLTKERLLQWQQLVLCQESQDHNPEQWRQSEQALQMICPDDEFEHCEFSPPAPEHIDSEIEQFLAWYNRTNPMTSPADEDVLSGPVRAAIAHLWFESIHPFASGNGRVGRAIAEQALSHDLGHPPMLSLSSQIKQYSSDYFYGLGGATGANMDVTDWINWFTRLVFDAQKEEMYRVDGMVQLAAF